MFITYYGRESTSNITIHSDLSKHSSRREFIIKKRGVPIDKMNYFWSISGTDSVAGQVVL
jgi:hypothetical protein